MNSYVFAGLYPKTKAKFLKNLEDPPIRNLSPDRLVSIVSQHFEISENDLLKRSRKKEVVVPRHWLFFLLYEHSTLKSFLDVGDYVGYNHSTIIHARTNVKNGIFYYREYKNHYQKLIKRIQDD
jgi:chromosomal replication initiator protein